MSPRALAVALLLTSGSIAFAAAPRQQAPPPSPPAPPTVAAQAPGPAPPAPQVAETHGDWSVVCGSQNNRKICTATSQLTDKASGRRIVGIELRAAAADRVAVTIVLPFGPAVDKPVTIRIDDSDPITVPFKTCVQIGCLATTTWELPVLAALRKGTVAFIGTIAADTGKDVTFRISLNGVGTAFDRALALSAP